VGDSFYRRTLARLLREGTLTLDDEILVVCGGPVDRETLSDLRFTSAVITNLDERMTGDEYAPYRWQYEDAEALSAPDDSVDWGLVHHGLHHCASPHRAFAELLRVGRKGAIVFEARDSVAVRAGLRLGWVEEFEVTAVEANDGKWGGVRNGPVPNHVYRWTEREVRKTVNSLRPTHDHEIRYFYGVRVPVERWGDSRGTRAIAIAATIVTRVLPKQGNEFAFVVRKDVRAKPWVSV
jgi:SAM-dependent methyltransferase